MDDETTDTNVETEEATTSPKAESEINEDTITNAESEEDNDRNAGLAAGLSAIGLLFPIVAGAGQVSNGDTLRCVGFSVLQMINVVGVFFFFGLFTYPVCGVWAIYDAYKGDEAPLYGITN